MKPLEKNIVSTEAHEYLKEFFVMLDCHTEQEYRAILQIDNYIKGRILKTMRKEDLPKLSELETSVIKEMCKGLDDNEIAEKINKTAKHVSVINTFLFKKFEDFITYDSFRKRDKFVQFAKEKVLPLLYTTEEEPTSAEEIKVKFGNPSPEKIDITTTELKVLQLLCKGLTYKETAEKLFISETTLKTHVNNIFQKLQVHDRTQAVIYAFKTSLVVPDFFKTPVAQAPVKQPVQLDQLVKTSIIGIDKVKELYLTKKREFATQMGLAMIDKYSGYEHSVESFRDKANKIHHKIKLLEEIENDIASINCSERK